MAPDPPQTRRRLLRATSGALAALPLAGCSGVLGPTDDAPTRTVTPVPLPDHRVAVGLERFDPRTVYARPGATVAWEWQTDGHNIVVRQRPDAAAWDGHESVEEAGYSYAYTFEVEGTYLYACDEHALVDGVGHARIVVTDDPAGSRRSDVVDYRDTSEVTVAVGPGGNLTFEPSAVRVSPGTTLRFVWDSDNHSIVVGEQPAGATWNGHDAVEDAGFAHAHTFTATGRYEYWCGPHRTAGMVGTILVGTDE